MKPLPAIPEDLPTRGNRFTRRVWQLLLHLIGWDFEGTVPNLPRFVIIGAPHTSNWDFVVAMLIIGTLGMRVTWLGKHTIFRWPLGVLLRRLGGIPVDRSKSHGIVDQATEAFSHTDQLVVGMAPEGTRRRTRQWKTGFYHIAAGAGVPIVPAYLDFRRKRVGMGSPVMPTNDLKRDLGTLQEFYAPYARGARRPELYGQG